MSKQALLDDIRTYATEEDYSTVEGCLINQVRRKNPAFAERTGAATTLVAHAYDIPESVVNDIYYGVSSFFCDLDAYHKAMALAEQVLGEAA